MISPLNPFHSIAAERLLEHAREDGEWITWKLSPRPEPHHGSSEAHPRTALAREFAAPWANTDPINHFQMFMDRQAAKARARTPVDPEAMGRALAAEAAGCPFKLGELLDRVTAAARAAQARAHDGVV